MASNHDQGKSSRVASTIPTNQKEALFLLAKYKSMEQRETVSLSELITEYIEGGLKREDHLPNEVREDLDQGVLNEARSGDRILEEDSDDTEEADV